MATHIAQRCDVGSGWCVARRRLVEALAISVTDEEDGTKNLAAV